MQLFADALRKHDCAGTIEVHEFAQPDDGLADSIIASLGPLVQQ